MLPFSEGRQTRLVCKQWRDISEKCKKLWWQNSFDIAWVCFIIYIGLHWYWQQDRVFPNLSPPLVTAKDFTFLHEESTEWPFKRPWIISTVTYKAIEECPASVISLGLNRSIDLLPSSSYELTRITCESFLKLQAKEILAKRDKVYLFRPYGEVSLLYISFSLWSSLLRLLNCQQQPQCISCSQGSILINKYFLLSLVITSQTIWLAVWSIDWPELVALCNDHIENGTGWIHPILTYPLRLLVPTIRPRYSLSMYLVL